MEALQPFCYGNSGNGRGWALVLETGSSTSDTWQQWECSVAQGFTQGTEILGLLYVEAQILTETEKKVYCLKYVYNEFILSALI